jgi:hypothetical protein
MAGEFNGHGPQFGIFHAKIEGSGQIRTGV